MICQPCRDTHHERCIDSEDDPNRLSRRCFCQHKVNVVVEPEEGDPHDC